MLDAIPLSYYALSGLLNFVTSAVLIFFIFLRNSKSRTNQTFSIWAFTVAGWSFFYFLWLNAMQANWAEFYLRTLMLFVIFIPSTFTHFILSLVKRGQGRKIIVTNYLISFLIGCSVYTDWFARDIGSFLVFPYWLKPQSLFMVHSIHFFANVIISHVLMFRAIKNQSGVVNNQVRYIFIGTAIGYVAGIFNYLTWYRIPIPPFLNPLVSVYVLTIAIAIIRYRFLDIRVIITRTTIFILVYSLVLGVPFLLGYKYALWKYATWTMLVLATAGPFIYLYIKKRAEDSLLQEQRRYQTTLRQASAGMGRIKDLKKLLNLIVYVVTRSVRLEHALVYVWDDLKRQFVLGAVKRRTDSIKFPSAIPGDSILEGYLIQNGVPVVYEEIKQRAQDFLDSRLRSVERILEEIRAAVVFPIFIDKRLVAIIVLGRKESGKSYGEEDISVFSILANQAALAIENAKFYEDMKTTQEQLFQAEKMATIGTMADGLSHQINNRFHALGFIAGDALDTIKVNKDQPMSDKLKEVMADLEKALRRVQENVVQGGEVVQGLLKYTRKGDLGFAAIDFDQVFKAAFEMAQFKIKTKELRIVHAYDPATIPKIKGNFTQLQEVFFNLIDNGYDAMMQRKNELKEPGYQPTLTVTIRREDGYIGIIFADNGMGVKDADLHKLFTPFFTTKLSSKKGTGLGLYVIQKIIEDNHKGMVKMASQHMVGTQMKLRLPIADV